VNTSCKREKVDSVITIFNLFIIMKMFGYLLIDFGSHKPLVGADLTTMLQVEDIVMGNFYKLKNVSLCFGQ
jgi:hypothetical protein